MKVLSLLLLMFPLLAQDSNKHFADECVLLMETSKKMHECALRIEEITNTMKDGSVESLYAWSIHREYVAIANHCFYSANILLVTGGRDITDDLSIIRGLCNYSKMHIENSANIINESSKLAENMKVYMVVSECDIEIKSCLNTFVKIYDMLKVMEINPEQ